MEEPLVSRQESNKESNLSYNYNESPSYRDNTMVSQKNHGQENPRRYTHSNQPKQKEEYTPGDELGAVFDYMLYFYKFFQRQVLFNTIQFILFSQLISDQIVDRLKMFTSECKNRIYRYNGINYTFAIMSVFLYFLQEEAIKKLAAPAQSSRVALKLSLEMIILVTQVYIIIDYFTYGISREKCIYVYEDFTEGDVSLTMQQVMDMFQKYILIGCLISQPFAFMSFFYFYLRLKLKNDPMLQQIYEMKYLKKNA